VAHHCDVGQEFLANRLFDSTAICHGRDALEPRGAVWFQEAQKQVAVHEATKRCGSCGSKQAGAAVR
jgi:hypothetical protein